MRDTERGSTTPLTGVRLTAGQLSARRAASRRHRRRRRIGLGVVVLIVALVVLVVARGIGSGNGPTVAAKSAKSSPTARPVKSAHVPHTVHHHAVNFARPVDHVLGYTSYVQFPEGHRRDVALTFDDGPSQYTHSVVKILERTHTPATFFVVGEWARAYPRLVASEAQGGFEIGDHTETHAYLTELSASGQVSQITDAASAIRRAGAPAPVLFRPPYGSFNPETLSILRAHRLLMVMWGVDTSDYERPGVAKIVYAAVSGARNGAIILMHDGGGNRSETVAALPRIISRLRQRGFHLVTVSQLVADDPPPKGQSAPQPLSGTP